MTSRPIPLATLFAFWALAVAGRAAAAEPTKQECVAANENAQDLRHAGRLREARKQLAACTAASCPAVVRADCAQRLKEVEAALPSIVFAVKDRGGHDLSAVRVTMDGGPLLQTLDGTGIAIDPGEHRFVFEADGFRTASSMVVVREGDADRPVRIVLESTAPPPGEGPPPEAPPAHEESLRRPLGLGLGIAGLAGVALGGVFGIWTKLTYDHARSECPPGVLALCPGQAAQANDDLSTAKGQALVSTIAFIGGGALVAVGALLFFTAPDASSGVSVGVASGGGAISFGGRWR